MTDFKRIYNTRAADYDRMISREDYEGNVLKVLEGILPRRFGGGEPIIHQHIIDIGSGTGRLARLTAPVANQITALDISPHMLVLAKENLAQHPHCTFAAGDNRMLPLKSACANVVMAGWSLGHSVGWYPDTWRVEIGRVLAEMKRLLLPGGRLIVFETLGTGSENPNPPNPGLAAFYDWLENERGFESQWIRTDYQFESAEEAARLTRFFFGDELADRVLAQNLAILPECTGVWWLSV